MAVIGIVEENIYSAGFDKMKTHNANRDLVAVPLDANRNLVPVLLDPYAVPLDANRNLVAVPLDPYALPDEQRPFRTAAML